MESKLEFKDVLMVAEHLLSDILTELQTNPEYKASEHMLLLLAEARALLKVYTMSINGQSALLSMNREGEDTYPF